MRLWSLHPRYLDAVGLTACWREALLAQKVLAGATRGYRHHPQLERFRAGSALAPALGRDLRVRRTDPDQKLAVGWPGDRVVAYLHALADEADGRGYTYDRTLIAGERAVIGERPAVGPIDVTDGQVAYEWGVLRAKLAARSPEVLARWRDVVVPDAHPLFVVVAGPVAPWEVVPR